MRAKSAFEMKTAPEPTDITADDPSLGRPSPAKRNHGGLEAAGKREMLSAGNLETGQAGYVAIERVNGALQGGKGTFVFQHTGSMNRGAPSLTVTVVPDRGTGELAGIAGTIALVNEGGKHAYVFECSLP